MQNVEIAGVVVDLTSAQAITAGHGCKKIIVVLYFNGEQKEFYANTNNMPAYDEANDLEGDARQQALYDIIADVIECEVSEWLDEMANNF